MDNNYIYKKIDVLKFQNKNFCKFINDNNKIAFLINENGKYYYPSIEDLVGIIKQDNIEINTLCALSDDDNKYYYFIPKVWVKNIACIITYSLLMSACAPSINDTNNQSNVSSIDNYSYDNLENITEAPILSVSPKPQEINIETDSLTISQSPRPQETEITTIEVDPNSDEYNFDDSQKDTNNQIIVETQNYYSIIDRIKSNENEPQVYKYSDEYYMTSSRSSIQITDSINYKYVFGYDMPSKSALFNIIDNNSNIPSYYKDLIKRFINNTLEDAPNTDFTILAENLKKLQVIEKTGYDLAEATISDCALACFVQKEDIIYTDASAPKDEVFEAVFYHELGHCSRLFNITTSGLDFIKVSFSPLGNQNLYTEEAIDTISTSRDNVARLYPLLVNYINIVIENTGYSTSDYFNHSILLFEGKIEKEYGDIIKGSSLVALIENVGTYVYGPRSYANRSDIDTLNTIIIKIYLRNHPEATFEDVYNAINNTLSNQRDRYEEIIGENSLRIAYDQATQELGKAK